MKTLTNITLTGIEEIDTKLITNELSLTYFLIMARAHNLSNDLVLNLISEVWPTKKSMKGEDVTVIKQHLKDGAWKHVFKKHPDPAIRKLCITPACEDIFDELVCDEDPSVRMAFLNNSSLFIVNNYYPILAEAAFKLEMLYKMQNLKQDCYRYGLIRYHEVADFLLDLLRFNEF